jgi:peptidoglycan-N-acetylglucosamine deacetylase
LKRRRRWVLVGVAAVILGGTAWVINERRSAPWSSLLNPAYWFRRSQGEDLYDAKNHILYHGNRSLKEIALTIDDGPHTPTGDQLLDILKQEKVKATFFVVGRKMRERPDLVERMVAEGHEIANHTQDHYRLPTLKPDQMRRELNDPDIELYRIAGRHMDLMRPPGVQYNQKVLDVARELGYETITVSVAAKDFEDVTPDFIVRRVLSRTTNGSIILLHDDRQSTVYALPRIIEGLRRQGYRFVTVSEMLAHLPKPVVVETNANSGPDGNPRGRTNRNRS